MAISAINEANSLEKTTQQRQEFVRLKGQDLVVGVVSPQAFLYICKKYMNAIVEETGLSAQENQDTAFYIKQVFPSFPDTWASASRGVLLTDSEYRELARIVANLYVQQNNDGIADQDLSQQNLSQVNESVNNNLATNRALEIDSEMKQMQERAQELTAELNKLAS